MIRSALLLCAALLTAFCFACVQQPQSGGGSFVYPKTAATCSGDQFSSKVKYLDNYDPSSNPSQPPSGASALPTKYAAALDNAFQLAPTKVQKRLCALHGIYVNGGSCSDASCSGNSWGYRASSNKGLYIAISAGLWDRSQPYVYHLYETDILNNLLGWDPTKPYMPRAPTYQAANPEADNFDMTILATLGHELGHVLWYDLLKLPGGYKPDDFCYDPNTKTNFFSNSWSTLTKPPIWRNLLTKPERKTKNLDKHLYYPDTKRDIDDQLDNNSPDTAAGALATLYYQTSPWASYFSTLSPDEDFVETYKFYTLINAQPGQVANEGPLTSLQLKINYYSITASPDMRNIPSDYTQGFKQELLRKVNCMANLP
jgi:hypothetical protein